MDPQKCLFCRIVRKEIPAKVLFEEEHVLAFHDLNPQAPTHVLVIPKVHLDSLEGLSEHHAALGAALWQGARRAASMMGVAASGYRTVVNTGLEAGQSVEHLHVHVLGGRALGWPPG